MEILWTRTKTIVSLSLLALAVMVVVVKKIWFPYVDETFFTLYDYQRLQKAPANVLIFRPTKFAESRRAGIWAAPIPGKSGQQQFRIVGRSATLAETIAAAYQCQPSRVVLPADATKDHYDFLVTVRDKPAEKFQAVIKKKLGYVARWQDIETEVLQLKVRTPNHPGLKPAADATRSSAYKSARMHFKSAPVQQLLWMAENALNQPVEDKTGLSGNYDFAVAWDWRGRRYGPEPEAMKKSLAELGLTLVSHTQTMQMMVVEKAK